MSDQPPVYLLDKNVTRRAIRGLVKLEISREPEQEEWEILILLWRAHAEAVRPFITVETFNLLQRFTDHAATAIFLRQVDVMHPSRYFKRWARRLHGYGFTYEDAKVLSLGTFGTNEAGDYLGSDVVITTDQALINNYQIRLSELEARLAAMVTNLTSPFIQAALPLVLQPAEALTRLE
jgi:hypothetical protein